MMRITKQILKDGRREGGKEGRRETSDVSDYASEKNPNEDMAESIANYLLSPHKLRSCCPEKYEFIHNRIMLLDVERWGTSNSM